MKTTRSALGPLVVAMLAACAAPPPTHVHSLLPSAAPAAPAAALTYAPVVQLAPLRLPPQVEQPQWLVRLPDDTLALLEQERWAAPLRDELRAALVEALLLRHGVVELRSAPLGTKPALRVDIEFRRFESVPGREARIEGSWAVSTAATPTSASAASATAGSAPTAPRPLLAQRCDWHYAEAAAGSMADLAAAHRRALARLVDALGPALKTMAADRLATCPPAG